MQKENIVALIDIGNAETKVLIVELSPKLNIIACGLGATQGMKKNEILDINLLKESVHGVIEDAEKIAKIKARSACLSLSGMDLSAKQVIGLTSVKAENSRVSIGDIETARGDAYARRVPDGRTIVHRIKQAFCVDDSRMVDNPQGLCGKKLAYEMWVVDAAVGYLSELIQVPNQYGLRVEELFLASLASAAAIGAGTGQDKNCLVIDIGAGTTDFVLFQAGIVQKTGTIPVGGMHITNDIASALRIGDSDAERIKIKFGNAFFTDESAFGEIDLYSVDDELSALSPKIPKFKLNCAISLRVSELFELIRKSIGEETPTGTIFLTGGTAKLEGIAENAARVFSASSGDSVIFAEPKRDFAKNFNEPRFCTVVGMAELLFRHRYAEQKARAGRGFFAKFKELF